MARSCEKGHNRPLEQGWGLLSRFPPFFYFPIFSALSKHTLDIEYHRNIWQVSPQLSCGDTCQIWMWFKESKRCFCKFENFAYGEIDERSLSNPHPWNVVILLLAALEVVILMKFVNAIGHTGCWQTDNFWHSPWWNLIKIKHLHFRECLIMKDILLQLCPVKLYKSIWSKQMIKGLWNLGVKKQFAVGELAYVLGQPTHLGC